MSDPVGTLVDIMRRRAAESPQEPALIIVDGDQSRRVLTRAELDAAAVSVASALVEVAKPGDRVALGCATTVEFVTGFFGALYAGVCAVPCILPTSGPDNSARRQRFHRVISDARPTAVLTLADDLERIRAVWPGTEAGEPTWLVYETLATEPGDAARLPAVSPDSLAFLQYTSGSTAQPKGVMVGHANLMAQMETLTSRLGASTGHAYVSWIPLFHDMGLVGIMLSAQYCGALCTLMPPRSFVEKPLRWLEEISGSDRPVISFAPNFALNMCVDRVDESKRVQLDLTPWWRLVVGAEPISMRSVRRFVGTYEPHGLRPETLVGGYGMAEMTLAATLSRGGLPCVQADADALADGWFAPPRSERVREIVACGQPLPGCRVEIVEPASRRPCGDGEIGEVWLAGDSVAGGYWNNAQASAETFGATRSDGSGPFLRTGDLGFLHDGQVYITGRLKDLIIVRGRNIYPQDVEEVAGYAHPGAVTGIAAAFGFTADDAEQLVVVQAVRPGQRGDLSAMVRAIRQAVVSEFEVEPYDVVLVRLAGVPRTTSGKIKRAACREAYLSGSLAMLASARQEDVSRDRTLDREALMGMAAAARRGAVEAWLRERAAAAVRMPSWQLDSTAPLASYGIDSLRLTDLRFAVERALRVSLSTEAGSLAEIVDDVVAQLDRPPTDEPPASITLDPQARFEPFPLTDLQYAYFAGRSNTFELGGVSTHAYFELEAVGLDVPRLEQAWARVVARHDMLRAVVLPDGRQQVLQTVEPYRFAVSDGDAAGRVRERMAAQVRPVDEWPLWEICVSRLDGGRVRLHVSFDLIIADLWSLRLIMRDWARCYAQPEAGLPEIQLSFRDHVLAQAAPSPRAEAALAYWRERAESLPGPPELPLVVSPRDVGQPAFVRRSARIPAAAWERVKTRAARAGVTPTVALLAAYGLVLGRWSKEQHFTLNLTLFNRPAVHPDITEVVGDFTSIEPLEVDLRQAATFTELAQTLQRQLRRDLAHGGVSGVRVLREMAQTRGSATGATMPIVFTSGIGQQDAGEPFIPAELGRLGYLVSQTPQVYLDHQAIEDGGELLLGWDSVDELFADRVLDDMFGVYRDVVQRLADEPAWGGLAPDLPRWQADLFTEVNATAGALPSALLPDAVLARALSDPDGCAVYDQDRWVSFEELAGRAVQLATVLTGRGVGRGVVVAVGAAKGWRQIVAVLAVSAAGGVYLPVDLGLPQQRRQWLLEHAGASCVLIDPGTAAEWAGLGVEALPIPEDDGWQVADVAGWVCPALPDDTAYVIYTSGSTGQPKGVAVSHRAALNTLEDVCRRYRITDDDRVLGLSSLSFDLSVFDIFGVLGAGGGLVLPDPGTQRDPQHWWQLVVTERVTVWNSVPALAAMLAEQAAVQHGVLPLRVVMLSGDWVPVDLPGRLRQFAQQATVVSLGGATEAAVWSIAYPTGDPLPGWTSVPYGLPLANQRFAVVNSRGEPCPVWVPGQLLIGGEGLAQGYWHDPERTAASFVERADGRWYRTGDLGRYRPDGLIEFLGREDFQVKVGGYRIELGEIEHALAGHPDVDKAVVIAAGDRGHQRLIAYLTNRRKGTDDVPEEFGEVERDPANRLAFTLARHALRRLDGEALLLAGQERPRARWTERAYLSEPVPLERMGRLLTALRARPDRPESPLPSFDYGSAGGLYPVQLYAWVKPGRVADARAGGYYYDPDGHRLVRCGASDAAPGGLAAQFAAASRPLFDGCAFALFLVLDHAAIEPMYGAKARDFGLIEAGLIAQLLETAAPDAGLGLCQVGGVRGGGALAEAFALNHSHELLHVIVGGIPDPAPTAGTVTGIRDYLAQRLPAYMVPDDIRVLSELPLSAQGKVDRKALASLGVGSVRRTTSFAAPSTDLERTIVETVGDVLGIGEVGARDNFFELGANSVRIAAIYARLRQRLDRDFPLLTIFDCPNAAALALRLDGNGDDHRRAALDGLERGRRLRAALAGTRRAGDRR